MTILVEDKARPTSFYVGASGLVDFTLIEDDEQPTEPKRGEEETTEDGERVGGGGAEMCLGRRTYRLLPASLVPVLLPDRGDHVLVDGFAA